MKKRILIVSQFFYPINNPRSLRTTELVKEFAKQGHEVTLLTPKDKYFHPKFEKEFKVRIKPLGYISFNDESLNKPIDNKPTHLKKSLYNWASYLFDYPNILGFKKTIKALKSEKGYDLLITIAVPHMIHWAASFVQDNNKGIAKTWIGDCGDPFMGIKMGRFKRPYYFKYFEKKWCRQVDFIAVPFEGAVKAYYKEFRDKIRIVPQGFCFPEIKKKKKERYNVPTFIYSGSIHPYKHYYEPFFRYLRSIDLDYKLIIFSKSHGLIKDQIKGIENKIALKNYVEREQLLECLVEADFLVHFPYLKDKQRSLKLIDYQYSKTPILSYRGGDDDVILKEFLNGNYKYKMKTDNLEQFKIENVCHNILMLK